jgi:hypothetical protein
MKMYALSSGCAAALVIARRGQGRVEKVPKSLRSYFRKPEDMLKSGAWRKVAQKSCTKGGFNRNKFYFSGSNKKVPTNCRMHGKLRSQRPKGVRQSPTEGNPPAALAHRALVPKVEATGVQTSISRSRGYGIVQVLMTPHIRQKPREERFSYP